jgi:hypothetical protein
MKDPHLEAFLGRRIVGAVFKEARERHAEPSGQLFLILDDGTYREVFAPSGGLKVSSIRPGGAAEARAYLEGTHEILYEAHLT